MYWPMQSAMCQKWHTIPYIDIINVYVKTTMGKIFTEPSYPVVDKAPGFWQTGALQIHPCHLRMEFDR